ncbi:MAG: SDR family oxidoreductase [Candidatus Levybacteria bacterium]|nr:SDR family oxidoreductase [Candidatus Levybacteria bacterium]
MQIILVAGGAGFIGSNLCRALLDGGYKVICIDNFITGNRDNIKSLQEDAQFKFIEYDIVKDLSAIVSETSIDYIFHLASPASPNKKSPRSYINYPIETLLANSQGTYQLLEFAKRNRAKFLYASSSEIYGDPNVSPQKESYFGNVNPNGVRSVYDEGKRFGEAMVMAYVRKFDLDCRIVRIFNTYGPKMQADDGRVVSNFINQAIRGEPMTIYGTGKQTRSFCYVKDMVEGLKRAMFKDGITGEVINLGNPDERTIEDLAKVIKKKIGSYSEIVFEELSEDDPKTRKPDIAKAEKLLQWKPEVSLEEGLSKTIDYFKSI